MHVMSYFFFLFRSSNDNPIPYCRSGTRRASNVLPAFDFRPDTFGRLPSNVRRTMLSVSFLSNFSAKIL